MIEFDALIEKFGIKGEKSGWTYLHIPAQLIDQLNPGIRQSFRVKGRLDQFPISGVALIPMGEGEFIMPLNAKLRKGVGKQKGERLMVEVELDLEEKPLQEELMICLEDEPKALQYFQSLPKGHQRYFSSWVESAKTEATRTRRISQAVNALALGLGFSEMIRMNKKRTII